MFKLEAGQKLKAKRYINCKTGNEIESGDILVVKEFFFDIEIHENEETVHLLLFNESKELSYHVHIFIEHLKTCFTLIGNKTEVYSLEELQAAYNSVIMSENGYDVETAFASPVKHSTQVSKDLYQSNLKSLMDEIEAFNEQTFKECAINVALDNGDK